MTPTTEESAWLSKSWANVPKHGDSLPLFGVRSTSAVEGDNNGLLWKGVRNKQVLGSLMAYCTRALQVLEKRKKLVSDWNEARFDVTPHAKELFDDEKLRVALQTVIKGAHPIFYVFDAFDPRNASGTAHMYEVDMASRKCTRCTVSEQLQVPCRHIQAVLYELSKSPASERFQWDVKKFFHDAYTVPKMVEAFRSASIRLPLYDQLEWTDSVKPPPTYRQAGRPQLRPKDRADIVRGGKRKPNRGEGPTASTSSARHHSPGSSPHCDEESTEISLFFDGQVTAAQALKRKEYHCSRCGLPGHNIQSCTNTPGETEEAGVGILPGEYVLGECPFKLRGIHAAYAAERSKSQ
jgi:hypothetical protein